MGAQPSRPQSPDGGVEAALAALEREQLAAALAASLAPRPADSEAAPPAAARAAPAAPRQAPGGGAAAPGAWPPAAQPHAPRAAPFASAQQCLGPDDDSGVGGASGAGGRLEEEDEALALALALSASEAAARDGGGASGDWQQSELLSGTPFQREATTPPAQSAAATQLAADAALAAALAEAELAEAAPPAAAPPAVGASAVDTSADAALAAALQAEEQAAAPPPVFASRAARRAAGCAGCDAPLGFLSGATLTALGRTWHASCFRCVLCGQRIVERSFAVVERDGEPRPAHAACQREAYHPRCAVCHGFIPAHNGAITFKLTPVWDERWCPAHERDGTRRCCGCERLEPRPRRQDSASDARDDASHATLPDGRALCVGCVPSAVVDEADAAPLYADVRSFFAELGAPLPAVPPLRLVDSGVLAALAQRDDAPHEADAADVLSGKSTLRGITLTEEVVVRQVARSNSDNPLSAIGAALSWGLLGAEALPRRVGCRVSCIAVLSSLPRLLSGSVLAHECCHALLRLGGPLSLQPRVEEGVCQLFALLWLERQAATLQEPRAVAHAAQLAHAIRNDASEVYGGGARDAIRAYRAVGLARLLEAVRATGRLPPVPEGAGADVGDELDGTH